MYLKLLKLQKLDLITKKIGRKELQNNLKNFKKYITSLITLMN